MIIEKGGDVIPKVVRVVLDKRPEHTQKWQMPIHCPACGHPTVRSKDEVAIRCVNKTGCPAQELLRLIFSQANREWISITWEKKSLLN